MKLLFFNYEYPPLGGGAANATSYIMHEFAKLPELEVDLITSSVSEKYELETIGRNIRIHKLPVGKNGQNLHYQSQRELLIYAVRAYFFARKLLKKDASYDLSHSFFSVPCGFISMILKWQFRVPYLVSLRGADVPGYSERFSAIYSILTPLIKLIWSQAKFVVANSQGLKELALKSRSKQNIDVIYNGVDTQEFQPDFSKRKNENPTVLCVSRLTERKGIKYLIEAFSILSKSYSNLKLTIAGEGNEMEKLKEYVQELNLEKRIDFLGRVSHEKLPEIYQQSFVFVLPSLNEGMSNTMLEAVACGLPIIATDTGGTRELVNENRNGFIVKMKNAQDIAQKIEILLKSPELTWEMSQASREKALELNWEKVALAYLKMYKSIQ